MPASIKVHADRPQTLCTTCAEATVIEYKNGTVDIACHAPYPAILIHRPVLRCSSFRKESDTSKKEMEKIAWEIRTDSSGLTIGFKPPKKIRVVED